MCKFSLSVVTKSAADIADAKKRLGQMPCVSQASVTVAENGLTVQATVEVHGIKHDQLRAAAWISDNWPHHPNIAKPGVRLLA